MSVHEAQSGFTDEALTTLGGLWRRIEENAL